MMSRAVTGHAASIGISGALSFLCGDLIAEHAGWRAAFLFAAISAGIAWFTVALIVQVLLPGEMGYDKWAGIFSHQWMKALTFVVIVSMLVHVWVGVRDVLMDYVTAVGARLALQVCTIVWMVGCTGWAIQVIWRL